ncbi:MAG: folate-binding protein [Gemmatimonadetes bacterium]|nr:folate-binding protein [Gemmatimonadota bacterium]
MTHAIGNGYRAAREDAAFIDRSDRLRLEFTGAQAAATLNGLLTNDVATLKPGFGHYAAALTVKGKIIADVRVFARNESYLVDTSAAAAPALLTMLRKYVNPRLAKYEDVSATLRSIGVFGPHAARTVAASTGVAESDLSTMPEFAHIIATGTAAVMIARVPDLGVPGFDLLLDADVAVTTLAALAANGAVQIDAATADVLRIEAGRPLFGADFDENVLAQEAAFDRLGAISFDKGCYAGQETVARVHFRGHVNRTLRGLRGSGSLERGAELATSDGTVVGGVRSAADSPTFGAIALAYVRREVADGDAVTIRASTGDVQATVVALPFAATLNIHP